MKYRPNPFSFVLNVVTTAAAMAQKSKEPVTASEVISRQRQAVASSEERLCKIWESAGGGYDVGELREDIDELLTEEEWTPSQSDYGPTT